MGKNVVRQVTAKNRYARALAAVTAWCRVNRHQSIRDQHAHLTAMMRGHYAYYGITGNFRRLSWYARRVATIWQKWLSRRDRRGRFPQEPVLCTPKAPSSAGSPDRPSLHPREQSSSMKNRKREICTSGTVRDEDGNVLIYSANDRGDRGDVGIIRSPVRASIPPDWGARGATSSPTRQPGRRCQGKRCKWLQPRGRKYRCAGEGRTARSSDEAG